MTEEDDDRAVSRIVQQEMLRAGVWIRLHAEDGTMLMSEYVPAGSNHATFSSTSALGMIHYLSIAIDGEEIWRGPGTGLPCAIPEGGSLRLNDVTQLIREARLLKAMKGLDDAREKLKAAGNKVQLPDDATDETD